MHSYVLLIMFLHTPRQLRSESQWQEATWGPLPLCPVFAPPKKLVGHYVRKQAELDGPLVQSSWAILMSLCCNGLNFNFLALIPPITTARHLEHQLFGITPLESVNNTMGHQHVGDISDL